MNKMNFIKHLGDLVNNRFALSALSDEEFGAFYDEFLKKFNEKSMSYEKIIRSTSKQDWYLIGTDGCHLCENSHALLTHTKAIYPNIPTVHLLDVMDSDDEMIDTIGKMIPLLLTPKQLLCYPFGVMDIVAICH